MNNQSHDSSESKRSDRLRAVLKPIAWMFLGGLLVIAAVFVTGVVPPGGTGGATRAVSSAGGDQLWTCGMHPEVIREEPGLCPICHMELVPLKGGGSDDSHAAHDEAAQQLWTCPMHPDILEPEPGSCPICGMDLVPVKDDSGPAAGQQAERSGETAVTIDPVVVQNMNVRVEPVERRDLSRSIRTVGHLDYDEEHMVSVTTRYEGFVEKVYVDYLGQPVAKGEPLFEVYSPELIQTQKELLSAVRYAGRMADADPETRRRAQSLVASARQRLSYWEISEEQVAAVEASGQVMRTLSVVSPISGVIMKRMHGLEGMAIRPGMEALHVADLSTLWLSVEVYENQLPWLAEGTTARVSFDYFPGEQFTGRVRYVEPEVAPATRTVQLTLELPNRDRRLRVGMYATVRFDPVVAENAVVVPAQAVIRSGARDVVVIALGEGRFAPREVTLGAQSEGLLQVLDGLDGSERVVTSAQFLIDSESNLRAAVEAMVAARRDSEGPEAASAGPGHQH